MEWTPLVGYALTLAITICGAYAAFSARLAKVETMIEELSRHVEKHNGMVERTYKIESDVATVFHRIDELREQEIRLSEKIERRAS